MEESSFRRVTRRAVNAHEVPRAIGMERKDETVNKERVGGDDLEVENALPTEHETTGDADRRNKVKI